VIPCRIRKLVLLSLFLSEQFRNYGSIFSPAAVVYGKEGENTPVELPVALPVFVCAGGDSVADFPVELPEWYSGTLHILFSSPAESIPEQLFPCHETDSRLVGNLFPTR